jgi:hypothetical protein
VAPSPDETMVLASNDITPTCPYEDPILGNGAAAEVSYTPLADQHKVPLEGMENRMSDLLPWDGLLPVRHLVIFRDSFPSAVISTTTSCDKIFSSTVIVRFSPITTFLPFTGSAYSGRIGTLEFCKSMVLTEKGFLSTCIFLRLNCPSLMADWTCRRKTLQSLVA